MANNKSARFKYRATPITLADGATAEPNIDVNANLVFGAAPTGSATSANQATQITAEQAILAKLPTVGTAGTASANVITVQGIASGTAQTVTPVTQTVATALLGASASQVIPAGAKGWSYAIITGTATVAGTALIPAGVGDSDPGTLAATLTITTAAASSAYVRWGT